MAMNLITKQDGTALHYSTMGQGYPVVLVHTVFDNYTVFNDLAKVLAKSFQVVLIDLRGHGYSDKPRNIGFHDLADDMRFLLDAIYIDEAAFIGCEMGALITTNMSVRNPGYISSATLVDPTSVESELPKERLFREYAYKIRNWEDDKQEKFLNKCRYYKACKINKFLKHVVDTNSVSTKEEIQTVKNIFKSEGIADVFKHVQVPTPIVIREYGGYTTTLEAKEVADLIQRREFGVYRRSGAYPFIEEQAQFTQETTNLIQQHAPK